MPEDDTNPADQPTDKVNAGDNTGKSGNKKKKQQEEKTETVKKKKKRRKRRPKKKQPKQIIEEVSISPEGESVEETEKPKKKKKKRRRKKKKPIKKELIPEDISEEDFTEEPIEEAITDEDISEDNFIKEPIEEEIPEDISEEDFIEEPIEEEIPEDISEEDFSEEPTEEEEPDTSDEELSEEELLGGSISGDEEANPEGEDLINEELPEIDENKESNEESTEESKQEDFLSSGKEDQVPKDENKPTDFTPKEEPEGPVGWDQLKSAIKQDYEQSESGVQPQPKPAQEPQPVEEPKEVASEPDAGTESSEEVPVTQGEVIQEAKPTETPAEPVPQPEKAAELEEDLASKLESIPEEHDENEQQEVIKIIKKYAIGGCIIIAIIAGIFIFQLPQRIYTGITGFISGAGQPVTTEQPVEDIPQTEEVAGEGVGTALVTGEQIPKVKRVSSAIQTVYEVGITEMTEVVKTDRIASYMNTLSKLQNAFSTDLHQLLDSSTDRAGTLEVHIGQLVDIYNDAIQVEQQLNQQKDEIKILYNEVTTEKERYEKEFFSAVEKLQAGSSNETLESFIDYSKQQVEYKAEFNALNKLSQLYEIALRNMDLRIKDIQVNRAALIKGVKVVDIKGSDLDLIIEESELNE